MTWSNLAHTQTPSMKYTPAKGIDTFKDKTLVVITFPPKFLDSFKIKVLNPLKTRQQSQNAFWLFVKESFSFFSMTRPAFQRLHLATQTLAVPRGKGLWRNSEEGITSRPTCGFAGTNSKRKMWTCLAHRRADP